MADDELQEAAHKLEGLAHVTLQFRRDYGLCSRIRVLPVVIATAVLVQFIQLIQDRRQRMGCSGCAYLADDDPERVTLRKLGGVQIAAIALQNRPDLMDDVSRISLGTRVLASTARARFRVPTR